MRRGTSERDHNGHDSLQRNMGDVSVIRTETCMVPVPALCFKLLHITQESY